jgi:hypothetical protein
MVFLLVMHAVFARHQRDACESAKTLRDRRIERKQSEKNRQAPRAAGHRGSTRP